LRIYLASTSPARLATLRAAGIEPVLLPSFVDEEAAVAAASGGAASGGGASGGGASGAAASGGVASGGAGVAAGPLDGPETVMLLARLKAEAVVGRLVDGEPIDGFILGGDSVFELDGVLYGKPHLPAVARQRWLLQRGREGFLHSGHWLIDSRSGAVGGAAGAVVGGAAGAVSTAAVRFAADITEEEIDAYVATGEPLNVAGAFTIDSLGAPFIAGITGDPHAVVGLSLATLRELLLGFGVSWPSLWNSGL
jgi:septum formation protein